MGNRYYYDDGLGSTRFGRGGHQNPAGHRHERL